MGYRGGSFDMDSFIFYLGILKFEPRKTFFLIESYLAVALKDLTELWLPVLLQRIQKDCWVHDFCVDISCVALMS